MRTYTCKFCGGLFHFKDLPNRPRPVPIHLEGRCTRR